ncbi:Uma2 family endonuclease [Methylobacterium sp. WL9]|uniref:Putative restriction endonuclease domain-containing protein n=2 Tax=Methylobacteriaceae TaxID=119045 RepID=A0ABQ4TQL9_9HYPH|nr:Uma2 family endonuclease [Methylobacterium sp. WL9]TXN23748.1 Uma2 family endonuclease [Methylobacterium sp. WL9]GJE57670.1 hypothetical protein EKPJFOCH_4188 [Methylobacterium thuringiense]
MGVQPKPRMTVDAFLAWAAGRDGKYELIDGEVVAMSPERVRHAETKAAVFDALRAAIRDGRRPCRALIDGVAVRVDAQTSYVPDVLVYCGERADLDAMEVTPVIVVEVVSPSSRSIDTNRKLTGYFRVPSVMHYLVVDPGAPLVIHHSRDGAGGIAARILSTGTLDLTPPGLTIAVADLFGQP